MTTTIFRTLRAATGALTLAATVAGCAGGGLGNVLGSVLGGGQPTDVSGSIQGIDTQNQRVGIYTADGQSVALAYDNRTQVIFQNQNYPVTSLERGDQVTARIQDAGNNTYYTDLIQVDRSVSGSSGTSSNGGTVQSFQGRVRAIDQQNGLFSMDVSNAGTLTVSLPYNVSRADQSRFQSLRPGDSVRLYGVFLNNSRVELRQFY